MKIIVVAGIMVPPVVAGSCQCIYRYCQLLQEMDHDVTFLYSGYATDEQVNNSRTFWKDKYYIYRYSLLLRSINFIKRNVVKIFMKNGYSIGFYYPAYGLAKYIRKINQKEKYDAIIVNYPWYSELLKHVDINKKLIFTHDKFTDKKKLIKAEYYSLSSSQERKALNRADVVLSIQHEETEYFKSLLPNKRIHTVYCPFSFRETQYKNNKAVMFFSGNSDLNLNGIHSFLNNVWPYVVKVIKDAKMIIGGGICKSLTELKGREDVILAGYIDDVAAFYNEAPISVNPVYQGTGLKIKTLEAIAYGKITIVHPHSVSGIFEAADAPVYVANNDQEYIEYVVSALRGEIDYNENSMRCEAYLERMNKYIKEEYKKALSE